MGKKMQLRLTILATAACVALFQPAISLSQTNRVNLGFHALVGGASTLQSTNPPYLARFPSIERIKADVRGVDAMETAAKQAGIFWQLHQLIYNLAYSQRRTDRQFSPDEQRMSTDYRNAYYVALQTFEGKVSGADKPRWFELHTKYEMDLWLLDEVMKKYFTPELRRAVYVALKGEMPTRNAPMGSTLVPSDAELVTAAERATPQLNTSAGDRADEYKHQGDRFIEAEDWRQAIVAYKEVVRINSNDPHARERLAFAYFNLKQFQEAAEALQHAVRLKPDFIPAHFALGLAYLGLGKKQKAIEVYRTLLTLNEKLAKQLYEEIQKAPDSSAESAGGDNAEGYKARGDKYFLAGDVANATDAYKKAIALKPSFKNDLVGTYLILGIYENAQGNHKGARAACQQGLALESDNARLYVELGTAQLHLKQYREAAAAYEEAIRLKPELHFPAKLKLNAEAHYGLGLTYLAMGQKNQALHIHKMLQRIEPQKALQLLAEINKK